MFTICSGRGKKKNNIYIYIYIYIYIFETHRRHIQRSLRETCPSESRHRGTASTAGTGQTARPTEEAKTNRAADDYKRLYLSSHCSESPTRSMTSFRQPKADFVADGVGKWLATKCQ